MKAGWIAAGASAGALIAYTLGAEAGGRWLYPDVLRRGPAVGRRIALTFDDGPHPRLTAATLDVLAGQGCPGAFFCIGERVRSYPELVRRAKAEGHLIGNHTLTHRHAWSLTPPALFREVAGGADALTAALGEPVAWMRPPWGAFNAATFVAARDVRQRIALYSVAPPDWVHGVTPDRIREHVLARAHPGAIVDLHDGGRDEGASAAMVAALPDIVAGLRAAGYELVRLDRLSD